jgi:hypothetical protein
MTLREALETGSVDQALAAARGVDPNQALLEARAVAIAEGLDNVRAAATTVMARLAITACPLPGSPASDSPDVIAAKAQGRATFVADERATLVRLAADPSPAVVAAAAAALVDATEDADLEALRPQLASALAALRQRAATDGDAAVALLRLEGGRAAVPWLVALVERRPSPAPIEALCAAVARAPVPEALAPLQALLGSDLAGRHIAQDRVRAIAQAIAAIDRSAATRSAADAPASARRFVEAGIVDDAIRRLATARPEELAALQAELGGLLPELEARCAAGDARAIPATLRLGGEALAVQWIEQIAGGQTPPAPLDEIADEAAQLGYHQAAAPLARIVETASQQTKESAAWAALSGQDAATAIRALRVLDPERAKALVADAPDALRQRLLASE